MSVTKASLTSLDHDGKYFDFQFNPKEFQISKGLTWQDSKEQGDDANSVQYQKGAPMTASFDAYFDTTGTGGNVQDEWVNPLLKLTKADVKAKSGEAEKTLKKRPSAFTFVWGDFSFDCVIEQVAVTFLMFTADGTAVRARAQVKLKEWLPPAYEGELGDNTLWDTDPVQLVTVSGSPSVNQVAADNNCDWRDVADANPDAGDLMNLEPGTTLVLPC